MEIMGIKEAAKALKVSENTLRCWADAELIQVVKLPSGTRRFPADDVKRLQKDFWEDRGRKALVAQTKRLRHPN
jgi:excisionase family DNA binding protein